MRPRPFPSVCHAFQRDLPAGRGKSRSRAGTDLYDKTPDVPNLLQPVGKHGRGQRELQQPAAGTSARAQAHSPSARWQRTGIVPACPGSVTGHWNYADASVNLNLTSKTGHRGHRR